MGSAKSKGVQNQPTPKVPIFRKNIPVETKSVYWMRYKYAGYKIAGSLEIEGDTLKGEIKYMEKTEDAKGLGDFLQTLETDAIANGCKYIEIEHDQCSPVIEKKWIKYCDLHGWELKYIYPFTTSGDQYPLNAGPNIITRKKINGTSMEDLSRE
jgi:hypothetical protein